MLCFQHRARQMKGLRIKVFLERGWYVLGYYKKQEGAAQKVIWAKPSIISNDKVNGLVLSVRHYHCGLLFLFLSESAVFFLGRHPHLQVSVSIYSSHILHSRCGYLQVAQSVNPACSTTQHLSCIFMPSDVCY